MKIKVTIPENLSEVTLGQYQRYFKIQSENEDENLLAMKMVEIFCNVSSQDVKNMNISDVFSITNMLADMFEQKPDLVKQFKMDGKVYGFIPNLEEMSFGEYIDLDMFLGDWDNIHKAMAVLYRPIVHSYGNKYNIEDYKVDDTDSMKQMPMDAALSSMLFFYRLGIELSQTMMSYLAEKEESNLVQYLNSLPNGVGINQYTHSLKAILEDLKISLN